MLRRIVSYKFTDVSVMITASIITATNQPRETVCTSWLKQKPKPDGR
jgi:hypothetical protein